MTVLFAAAGAFQAISSLLAANQGALVSIGGIELSGWAMPGRIAWGGEQALVIERLPGGAKCIQAMGDFDDPITLTGVLKGFDALDEAEALTGLRRAGTAIPLTCMQVSRQVIVKRFVPDQRQGPWINYTLELEVIPPTPGAPSLSGPNDLQSLAQADVSDADGVLGAVSGLASAASAGMAAIGTGLTTAETLLATPGVLAASTGLLGLAGAVAGAQGGVATVLGVTEAGLLAGNSVFASGFPSGAGSIGSQAAALLLSTVGSAGALAGAVALGGFVDRTARNVAAAQGLGGPIGSVAA